MSTSGSFPSRYSFLRLSRAARLALIYAGFSVLWIVFSDRALASLAPDRETIERISILKGWFFVVTTSLMLYVLLRASFRQLAHEATAREQAERVARRSEEQLRALGDNLPQSYVFRYVPTTLGPRFLHVSAGVERVHGVTVEAVLADPAALRDQIDPEDRACLAEMEQESRRSLKDIEMEMKFRGGDGRRRWLSFRSHPQRIEHDVVVWDGVATDITQQKEWEMTLRLSQAKFVQAFASNPAAIALTRLSDGTVLEVNDTWVALTGYTREEVIGRPARHIWATPEAAARFVQELKDKGLVQGWEELFLKKNGELFAAELSTRLLNAEGEAVILSTLVDVTARRWQQRRVTLLADISRRLVVGDDPRTLLRGIFADIARELECEIFANYLVAPNGTHLVLKSCGGFDPQQEKDFAELAFGVSLCGVVAECKRALTFADLPNVTLPQAQGFVALGVRAYSGHPLLVGDRLIGTISFGSRKRHRFVEEDVRLMKAVADQVATTLDRLQLHERLQHSEELFRQMAENIDEVFWMSSVAKDQIVYVSPGYEKVWGSRRESLYANPRQWIDAIVPDDVGRVLAAAARQASGDYREEYRIIRPDGTERWISDRAYPVLGADGKVIRIVGVARDITETKRLEEQFLRAQRLEAVGTLASGVAHDLNNILAPILMVTGLLGERHTDAETRRFLEMLETAAQRGAGIVSQLLTFSRGLGGERVPLQAEHLVAEMARLLQETLPRSIEIVRHATRDLPSVLANPTQVHQVLMNLCVNARDAMPQGGRIELGIGIREIDAETAAQHDHVRPGTFVVMTVSDTGQGMSPDVRRRLFNPFFTTKEVGKGTGLGLSTVLGIVRGHGGFVEVESELGRGSRFAVCFPALDHPAAAAPVSAGEGLPRGRGERLLVVDDEESIRFALKEVLEQFGYEAVVADGVAPALRLCRMQPGLIRLVITDLMMPGGDGWELVRELGGTVPVIICSGLAQAVTQEEAARPGVHCVLAKPFAAPVLLREIARALSGRADAK